MQQLTSNNMYETKRSAVAETGDRLATIDIVPKTGGPYPF